MSTKVFEMGAITVIIDGSNFPDGQLLVDWKHHDHILQAYPVVEGLGQGYVTVHLLHHSGYPCATLK